MEFRPIGVIRTPYKSPEKMPVQPAGAPGVTGRIEVDSELAEGLKDLAGFSHIIVLYYFHRAGATELGVVPFLDTEPRGVFATRAPVRPNPIGISIVELIEIEETTLTVGNVDMLDDTPLLDIKPYIPAFDQPGGDVRTGWFEQGPAAVRQTRSDERFTPEA